MISYTFSQREKALLVVLAIILVAIAWFMLVFQPVSDELASLDSQLSETRVAIDATAARAGEVESMRREIEASKEAGVAPVVVPVYDNLQPLTVELSGILGAVDTYSLSFGAVEDGAGGYLNRGVRIDFSCDSYEKAESVVNALAHGAFPCVVDSVSITDGRSRNGTRASGAGSGRSNVTVSAHVVFFERSA